MNTQDDETAFAKAWDEFLALREKAWGSDDMMAGYAAGKAFGRVMDAAVALKDAPTARSAKVVRFPPPRQPTTPKGGSAA